MIVLKQNVPKFCGGDGNCLVGEKDGFSLVRQLNNCIYPSPIETININQEGGWERVMTWNPKQPV